VTADRERSDRSGTRTGKRKDVHERALGLLAVRQRGRGELERRLVQAGFDPGEVGSELERLERVGLIDDEAFARAVVESRMGSRGESHRVVAMHLARAGVSTDVARAAMHDAPETDEDRAERLAEAKAPRLMTLEPRVAFQRLYGFLARRGYSPDVARNAARRALDATSLDE
jgi:regulatory protein